MEQRPDIIAIKVHGNPQRELVDLRPGFAGLFMGSTKDVADQYGVEMNITEHGLICRAPKSRLQMFAEKLHFGGVTYSEVR